MLTEASGAAEASGPAAVDVGLLSPLTHGHDHLVSDSAVLDSLIAAEVALVRAYASVGLAPRSVADEVETALGWVGPGLGCRDCTIEAADIAGAAPHGGNPVIPLVLALRSRVSPESRRWMHRGATSQDILDSALMQVAALACRRIDESLAGLEHALEAFATEHGGQIAAARTLTQHAVPTTVGLRAAGWLRGVRRASVGLRTIASQLPAQLGGAAGTMASFVEVAALEIATLEIGGAGDDHRSAEERAAELPGVFAEEMGLAAPDAPWHTTRWPVTELGDALLRVIDALGVIASDVATLARTEIGELRESDGGDSSAMPQKSNPVHSVLIRSAALRAPQLAATLHLASAFAVDERPDGAWHAEWPTLRELLRLALGAGAHGDGLIRSLVVDPLAVERNLALSRGLILAERLSLTLGDLVGRPELADILSAVEDGADLAASLKARPELQHLDIDALLRPGDYLGLTLQLVHDAVSSARDDETRQPPKEPRR